MPTRTWNSPPSNRLTPGKHSGNSKENMTKALLPSCTPTSKQVQRFVSSNLHGSPSGIKHKKSQMTQSRAFSMVNAVVEKPKIRIGSERISNDFYGHSPSRQLDTTSKLNSLSHITVTVSTSTKSPKKEVHDVKPFALSVPKSSRSYASDSSDEDQHKAKKFKRTHEKEPHLIGFKNQGGTCYMNSVLQVLSGLENFYCEVLEELPMMSSQLGPLQSLFRVRREGKDEFIYPCLREIHKRFALEVDSAFKNSFEQQDMDEFLTLYLDKIDSQIKDKRKELELMESSPTLVENNFSFKDTEKRICKKCQNEVTAEQVNTVLHVSLSQENVSSSYSQRPTVQQLVQSTLEGPWNDCSNCKEFNSVKTFKKFSSLPRTLLIVMMRYNNQGQKLETPIDICPYITLENFISSDCQPPVYCKPESEQKFESIAVQTDQDVLEIENPDTPETDNEDTALKDALSASLNDKWRENNEEEDLKRAMQESIADMDPFAHKPNSDIIYKLSAVINHYGDTPNSGHYKCDVFRKEKNRWYNYNDLSVEVKSSEEVLKGAEEVCYLLVYEFDGHLDAFKPQSNNFQQMTQFEDDFFKGEDSTEKHLDDARDFESETVFVKKEEP